MERLCAWEYVRRMGGATQSHLIRASDGRYYIIKVQNNPQGVRVLSNEMLGCSLARLLGLPAPLATVIDVSEKFIQYSQMLVHLEHSAEPCHAGLCCGLQFNMNGFALHPRLFRPEGGLENWKDILGMLVFDKWTSNRDVRQLMFYRQKPNKLRHVMMIDQGDCFCREKWTFIDAPTVGLMDYRDFYHRVTSLDDFEPWLYRLEHKLNLSTLRRIADRIPPEWYEHDSDALHRLLLELDRRRTLVRELLAATLHTRPDYFPRLSPIAKSAYCINSAKETPECSPLKDRHDSHRKVHVGAY